MNSSRDPHSNNDDTAGKVFRSYNGGKNGAGVYQTIINQIRPHKHLVIPFLGNCGIAQNIKHTSKIIGIDFDDNVIRKWKKKNYDWIELYNCSAFEYLENNIHLFDKDYVIYCDPPYLMNSRSTQQQYYKWEFTKGDHERLLKLLRSFECDILISCYPNYLYEDYLKHWRKIVYKSHTRAGMKTELMYMNYDNQEGLLHDYSYLGKNYRERERIKNKTKRWVNRLNNLNPYERNAILDSLKNNF